MPSEHVVLVNIFKCEPEKGAVLIELLKKSTQGVISTMRGWVSTRLIALSDGAGVIIYSEWKTLDDIAAMRSDERMVAYFPKIREIANFESVQGQVVMSASS